MRFAAPAVLLLALCVLTTVPMACDSSGTTPPPPRPLPGEWQPLGLGGETVGDITSIAVHPEDPGVIYVAAWGGLFKTTDGGGSWDSLRTNDVYSDVQISPQAPEIVYAVDLALPSKIIKSTDGGETWTNISEGLLTLSQVWVLIALAPTTPDVLYAGKSSTHGGCPYKTTDGGESWTVMDGANLCNGVTSLAVDPDTPEVVYAGRNFTGDLFKSTDGGETWSQVRSGFAPFIRIAPTSGTLYANIDGVLHRSEDGGQTWETEVVADSVEGLNQIAFRPQADERYLASREGVYLSRADSAWVEVSTGLPHRRVEEIAVGPAGNRLYAGLKRISGEEHGLYVRDLTSTQPDQ